MHSNVPNGVRMPFAVLFLDRFKVVNDSLGTCARSTVNRDRSPARSMSPRLKIQLRVWEEMSSQSYWRIFAV